MTAPINSLRLALAQLNPTLGDVDGNMALARAARDSGLDAAKAIWSCAM
jgi:NAD+ synthase